MKTASVELWRRAEKIFAIALSYPLHSREDFLNRACGEQSELRQAVGTLLANEAAAPTLPTNSDGFLRADSKRPSQGWIGRQIGAYSLQEKIGQGGMGEVYWALRSDGEEPRTVAIKVLQEWLVRPSLLRLLRKECQVLSRLNHPNIAQFRAGGSTAEGQPYVVMELIEGMPITDHADTLRLDLRQRLQLFLKACKAVDYAHRNFVVHSDLKPSNLLVTAEGKPKLLDFGIAKLLDLPGTEHSSGTTYTQERFLTPSFASPEQLLGHPISTASDIYSLGVLLTVLLTGLTPHPLSGLGVVEAATVVSHHPPRPPSFLVKTAEGPLPRELRASLRRATPRQLRRQMRGALDNIVLHCLAKKPADRYPSVLVLMKDIEQYLGGLPVLAPPRSWPYRLRHFLGALIGKTDPCSNQTPKNL